MSASEDFEGFSVALACIILAVFMTYCIAFLQHNDERKKAHIVDTCLKVENPGDCFEGETKTTRVLK